MTDFVNPQDLLTEHALDRLVADMDGYLAVTDVFVVASVAREDGRSSMTYTSLAGADPVKTLGMVRSALLRLEDLDRAGWDDE